MVQRRVTSTDVARAAGVSRSAVSMVLNGRAQGMIQAEKQRRIREMAKELGYVPNAAAVSLRRQSTATIGLVTDEIASAAFAGPLISGASDVALKRGYMVLTIDTRRHASYVESAMGTLRARGIDGLIYAAASVRDVLLPPAVTGSPVVLANAFSSVESLPSFVPDDRGGGRAATLLALEAGHREICFISGRRGEHATEERIAGFREVMRAAGLAVNARSLVPAKYTITSNYEAALAILRRYPRPTVLLCANDRGAVGAILAAAKLGLSVPGDVSIIGYDDEKFFAEDAVPPLTTVALPHRQMGEAAMEFLLRSVEGPVSPPVPSVPVQLACEPVVRRSLAAPPRYVKEAF